MRMVLRRLSEEPRKMQSIMRKPSNKDKRMNNDRKKDQKNKNDDNEN